MAELLVTLGVIAVVAAITAPALENLFPDQNKVKVLKVYKTISDINEEILNDPSLYMQESIKSNFNEYIVCPDPDVSGCFRCSGLNCIQDPLDETIKNRIKSYNNGTYYAIKKYPYIMFNKLDVTSDTPAEDTDGTARINFSTKDNIDWAITVPLVSNVASPTNANFNYKIVIDVNPDSTDSATNCTYSSANNSRCLKPERFSFFINNDGKVRAADNLTNAYLLNPTKMNDKKHDYECARNSANCVQQ